MNNTKTLEVIEKTLKQDALFVSDDDRLLKNKAIELAHKYDERLLELLAGEKTLKEIFFKQVGDLTVFDKEAFVTFVSNKEFLPDSYTAFKNTIGYEFPDGSALRNTRDIALAWPFKECVLEGGQTREDAKRREIFFNTTLAPDDIAQLLKPKVLTNFRRYDKDNTQDGHKVTEIREDDNFIIKGNNLLALHSLKKRYANKVKLIYIDPPYNTGNDGFQYNDSFNHSTWLVFMKNRLEAARELLREDGVIFVHCDDNEQAYLKVLMDEVFERENFVADFIWNHRRSSQNDIDVSLAHNYTLTFAKNRNSFNLYPLPIDKVAFSNPDNDPRGDWVADPFDAPNVRENLSYPIINPSTGETFYPPRGRHWRMGKKKFQEALEENRILFGKTGRAKPQFKRFRSEAEGRGTNPFTLWDDVGTSTEGTKELMKLMDGEKIFSTPKPERLLQRILEIGTKENDIVLDFFAGSGTSLAVAHKMGRRYIGVEQMEYIHDLPESRLKKVIEGEQGGISQSVGWKGGGSFVYCELMEENERRIRAIRDAKTGKALWKIWKDLEESWFVSWRVDMKRFDEHEDEFLKLDLKDQKHLLLEIIDKNMLYVNYQDIEDAYYKVGEEDKKLNGEFYGE